MVLTLKDARTGSVLDAACSATVSPEGLHLSGGPASTALGLLGWSKLLRVRGACSPTRRKRRYLTLLPVDAHSSEGGVPPGRSSENKRLPPRGGCVPALLAFP